MEQRALPRPGEFYRHFKNRLYQIVAAAYNADDGSPVVVYQALYGDFRVWVRPLEEFMSETDRTKYPDAAQKYRFEKIPPEQVGTLFREMTTGTAAEGTGAETDADPAVQAPAGQTAPRAADAPAGQHRLLLEFLDTEDLQEKKAIIRCGMDRITQSDLDGIYTYYGIQRFPGDVREQADGVIRYLSMRSRYEGDRLRGRE